LLVVQPSSMGPIDMDNLIYAIKQGQPVAVFEDPRPMFMQAPATGEPRPSPGGMMGRQQRPQPKADIKKLWKTLGIKSQGAPDMRSRGFNPHIAFQYYNPYRKLGNVDVRFGLDQWLFISNHNPASDGSSINEDDEITKGLVEVFLAVAGSIEKDRDGVNLDFTSLLSTTGAGAGGYITYQNVLQTQGGNDAFKPFHNPEKSPRHVAARIQGDIEEDDSADAKKKSADKKKDGKKKDGKKKDDKKKEDKKKEEPVDTGPKKLHVVYVADIDVLSGARRGDEAEFIRWNFQNVTFVLNIIDSLAGERRYIPVRGRRPVHHTLKLVEEQVHQLQLDEEDKRKKLKRDTDQEIKKLNDDIKKINDEFEKKLEKLRAENAPREQIIALIQEFQAQQLLRTRRAKIETERLNRDSDKKKKRNERRMELAIEGIQNRFKMGWVFGPLILPLVLGVVVFAQRRLREREGVSRNRLK